MPHLFYEFWHITIGLASDLLGRGSTPEMTDFPFEFWLIATGIASGLLGAAVASRSKLVRKVASLDRDLQNEKHQHQLTKVTVPEKKGVREKRGQTLYI